jgi:hypothetical protein
MMRTEYAAADIIITIITDMMLTKYSQAGEERQLISIHVKSLRRSLRSFQLKKITSSVSSSELRESSLIRIITGLSSTLYLVSMRSARVQQIIQESSVLSVVS